jgi:hypothetical protein
VWHSKGECTKVSERERMRVSERERMKERDRQRESRRGFNIKLIDIDIRTEMVVEVDASAYILYMYIL